MLEKLKSRNTSLLDRLRAEPHFLLAASGMPPDAWQKRVLRSSAQRIMLNCSRQSGKSETAAALSLKTALLNPGVLVLVLSHTLRQSGEFFRQKVLRQWRGLGSPLYCRAPTQLQLELSNGSRIVSLPENEAGIRGYSAVSLLVIDEASKVKDELYRAVRPMMATSNGRIIALSTPWGKRGWFYDEWVGGENWLRIEVKATQCPRIPAAFLEEEQRVIGPRWFASEYLCSFEDVVGSIFAPDALAKLLSDAVKAEPFL